MENVIAGRQQVLLSPYLFLRNMAENRSSLKWGDHMKTKKRAVVCILMSLYAIIMLRNGNSNRLRFVSSTFYSSLPVSGLLIRNFTTLHFTWQNCLKSQR